MTRQEDLMRLRVLNDQRAQIATARFAQTTAQLAATRAQLLHLKHQTTTAHATFEADLIEHLRTAQSPAHIMALPSKIAIIRLRQRTELQLLRHQGQLLELELKRLEKQHEERKSAVRTAHAQVEKFTQLTSQILRQAATSAEDAADEELLEHHNRTDRAYET